MKILALLCLLPSILALGINCRGETILCNAFPARFDNFPQAFYDVLVYGNQGPYLPGGPIRRDHVFQRNENIACISDADYGGICLVLEGNMSREGINGSRVISKLNALFDHGCKICGAVPLSDTRNDVSSEGQLVSKIVRPYPRCHGLCIESAMLQAAVLQNEQGIPELPMVAADLAAVPGLKRVPATQILKPPVPDHNIRDSRSVS